MSSYDPPIEDPIATFGMIIERAVEANDDGIIRKAIRVLDRRRSWEGDWDVLEHFLAQCAVQFPHSFDYVARVVAWRLRLSRPVNCDLWIDIARHAALHNGSLGRDSEACWAIWLLKELGTKLLKPLTDVLTANASPLTLAFLAHFPRHKLATDKKLVSNLRARVFGDPFAGLRIPTMPDGYSDLKPDAVPTRSRTAFRSEAGHQGGAPAGRG